MDLNKITYWFLGIYIGTSSVYWMPFIPLEIISGFKIILYCSSILLIFLVTNIKGSLLLPRGYLGLTGFLVIVFLSFLSLISNVSYEFIHHLLDLVYCFTFFFAVYAYTRFSLDSCFKAFEIAGSVFLIAIVLWLSIVLSGDNFTSPFDPKLTLITSGFGGLRTGWSNGIALLLPIVFLTIYSKRFSIKPLLILASLTLLVYGQVLVGGRAGILSSLFAISFIAITFKVGYLWILFIIIAPLMIWFNLDWLNEQLRINRLFTAGSSFEVLNNFSAGRVEYYLEAISEILERPFNGWGFGAEEGFIGQANTTGHMLWLRLAGQGGILLSMAFLIFVLVAIYRFFTNFKSLRGKINKRGVQSGILSVCCGTVIITGFIISFLEPNILIGSFQISAIWWASAGVLVSNIN